MVRKFLYLVAFLIVVFVVGGVTMQYWKRELSEIAFVPKVAFETQNPLAGNAYEDPAMWISRPGIGTSDPSRWLPAGWKDEPSEVPADAAVFFIHPTSYLAKDHWNAPLDDEQSQARARLFVRGMASPFNRAGEVWIPRYRQAAFGAFLSDGPEAKAALDAAYADVAQSFEFFLASIGKDTPIVIAGHSQGSLHLLRLLKDKIAGTPLQARIVAAYPVGWPISVAHDLPALGLPACSRPAQAGCIMSWSSFAEPGEPEQVLESYAKSTGLDGTLRGTSEVLCSNPLTGMKDGEAPASANRGTLVPDASLAEGIVEKALVPARCEDGLLLIGPPPKMGPYVLPGNNYHVYDIPLFWANLRGDVAARRTAWTAPN